MPDFYQKCTKENPMPKDAPGHWAHEGAECTGSNYEGDVDYWRCRDCGTTWKVYHEG
jgi:hypothetical protein